MNLDLWKNWRPGDPLFAVGGESAESEEGGAGGTWTISPSKAEEGWENDSGFHGYGLPLHVAKGIIEANEKIALLRDQEIHQCVVNLGRFIGSMNAVYPHWSTKAVEEAYDLLSKLL